MTNSGDTIEVLRGFILGANEIFWVSRRDIYSEFMRRRPLLLFTDGVGVWFG